MDSKWKKLAPLGLYLAALAAVVSIGIAIVVVDKKLPLQISLGLVVIGLALFTLLDPGKVRQLFTGKQAKYSGNLFILSLAVLGIIVVINFLAFKNPKRWDLTEAKEHTLAPETIHILNSLKDPVTAEAFYTSRMDKSSAETLLDNFAFSAKDSFSYQFIDPEANPIEAQAAKITRDGTIVLKIGDRQEQVTYPSEQEITSALVRLANPGERNVYFSIGHGEFDTQNNSDTSLTQLSQVLTNKNYGVKTLNLINNPTVPEDAKVLIIAGPKLPFTESEVKGIDSYVQNGGSLVVLTEPREITFQDQTDYLEKYLDDQWGIVSDNDIVIDPNVNPSLIALAQSYGKHSVTEKLMNVATIFPTSHSIQINTHSDQVSATVLITTSDMTWGETDFEGLSNNEINPDQETDFLGPLTLAAALENSNTQSRLVMFGDTDFASDKYFQEYGNSDLIVNSIDWAAAQDNLISLTVRNQVTRMMQPPTQFTLGLILFGFIILLPSLIIISGVTTWVHRKSRG